MLKLLARGVRARWTQYLLSAAAIAIGVALVSGTVVLAQSARSSYTNLLRPSSTGTDLFVRGPETDVRQGISDFAPVSDALLQRVRAVPGVAEGEGQVVRIGQLVTVAGRFLESDRPNYVYSWMKSKDLSSFGLTAGRAPAGAGEVAVSSATARLSRLRIGDTIRLSVDAGSPRAARIVGFVQRQSGPDLTGADAVFVSGAWAQRVTGIGNRWDLIEVTATRDVSVETLRDRINEVIPGDGTSVITRAQYDNAQLANLARRSSSLTAILLALSLLAAAVGCGLVFNTFSLLAAQRTRELSLLRTVGMGRAQVYLSVVGEGAIVGFVASTIGACAGLPAAYGLRRLAVLSGRNADIGAIHFSFGIVVTAAVVGTLACVAIAAIPARRASKVPPVAAWREAQPSSPEPLPARLALVPAAIALVGAVLLLASRFLDGAGAGLEIAGAVTLTLAVLIALPVCASPIFRVLGALAGRTGAAGAVAGTSAESNPRRVLVPVLALVLGLGMVTTVAVLAGSAHAAMHQLVSRADNADYVVVSDSAPGIDVEAIDRLGEAPAVRVASEMGDDTFDRAGHSEQFTALDSDTANLVLDLPVVSGALTNFSDGDILVTRAAARRWNYHVGDFVPVRFGLPRRRYLRVDAIIADNGITHDWVIPFETYRRGYLSAPVRVVFVKGVPGVDAGKLRAQVETGVNGFPGVSVLDAPSYARRQAVKAEGPIALVQALVGLSILVALLGVANSLSLSVVERVWELGLLDVL
ncbi:MAG: putative transport system permease protein, partial [Actinomycetota bacterium]|nr:putative transport system permease protein [Actinomycetota bacterium]